MKLNEISLYDLHKDPKSLYGYDRADMEIPEVFWDKYKNNPKELKKRSAAIAKSAEYSFLYAASILGRPWKRGEKAIAKSAYWSEGYARVVIQGRFLEGEKAIAKDPYMAAAYAEDIIGGSFPPGESAIAKLPETAYNYAVNVLGDRWPKGEPAIMKNKILASMYKRFLETGDAESSWG